MNCSHVTFANDHNDTPSLKYTKDKNNIGNTKDFNSDDSDYSSSTITKSNKNSENLHSKFYYSNNEKSVKVDINSPSKDNDNDDAGNLASKKQETPDKKNTGKQATQVEPAWS